MGRDEDRGSSGKQPRGAPVSCLWWLFVQEVKKTSVNISEENTNNALPVDTAQSGLVMRAFEPWLNLCIKRLGWDMRSFPGKEIPFGEAHSWPPLHTVCGARSSMGVGRLYG